MDKKQHTAKTNHTKTMLKKSIPLNTKKSLTDNINLSGPPNNDSKFTINYIFNLHDPLDTTPLTKIEIENIFLPITEKITLELLQKHQNLDPVIRQLNSWHKYKTKPIKADTTILGNKTLFRYFRKFNNTSINENTDILGYQTSDIKLPCLPFSKMLIAFHNSHSLHTEGQFGAEKRYSNFIQNVYFPNAPIWIKVLCNDCTTCHLNNHTQIKNQSQKKTRFYRTKSIFQSQNFIRYKRTNITILRRKLIYNGHSRCIHTLLST